MANFSIQSVSNINIEMVKGETLDFTLTFTDKATGDAIDLTGASITMVVAENEATGATKHFNGTTVGGEITITDAAAGQAQFVWAAADNDDVDLSPPTTYGGERHSKTFPFDIEVTLSSGSVVKVIGNLKMFEEVAK